MISPYVRRHRLATELIRLREEHGYSTQRLAKAIGVPRQRLSQLQNARMRPDLDEIMRILDVLKVGERRWSRS
ncbi:MAG TPA: helix-turn-helix transcriptional regulator [Pseudonocardiaceae bacterium]|nr:helix-turn-helix transcriptional regulator [Pseudonocardiaceae bacterium]